MPRSISEDNVYFSDPLIPQPQPYLAAESIISRNHYANDESERPRESTRSYTYRQRDMKINLTLGWELEANHAPVRVPAGVDIHIDGSVDGDGMELVVLPSITRSPRYALGLLKDLVHMPRLNTNRSCGFHVHVSASNISNLARMRQWAIATEYLALQIEPLAFEAVPDSRRNNQYCRPIVPIKNGASFTASKYNNDRRYHWLNIVEMFRPNGIRTIENRLLGHTHRWKYVLAWTLFTMELARRGWELSNKPFEAKDHIVTLGELLRRIAKEVKPLTKRAEVIPQWVYDGFKTFSIEPNTWDRPLARLSEIESDLRGMARPWYSDAQPEIPNDEPEDDDSSLHEDGECDSSECEECHNDENCGGTPVCVYCRAARHDNREYCESRTCGRCMDRGLVLIRPVTEVDTISIVNQVFTPRLTAIAHQVTETNNGTRVVIDSITLPSELSLPMTDAERLASDERLIHEQALSVNRQVDNARLICDREYRLLVGERERLNRGGF